MVFFFAAEPDKGFMQMIVEDFAHNLYGFMDLFDTLTAMAKKQPGRTVIYEALEKTGRSIGPKMMLEIKKQW